jgi:uncharacterized protein
VAAALSGDVNHRPCVDLFTAAHLAGERLLIPSPVVTEVCYMLAREGGARAEAAFLTSLADGDLIVVELEPTDWSRTAELVTAMPTCRWVEWTRPSSPSPNDWA